MSDDRGDGMPGGGAGVVREVELPAPVDDVWDALTDGERVEAWFGAEVAWDLRPGGAVRVGEGDDDSPARHGEVDEVEPARRLRFRWWPGAAGDGDPDGASVVTYELEPVPGGTRLVVTEVPLAPTATTARAATATVTSWDARLVGLWLGTLTGPLVRG